MKSARGFAVLGAALTAICVILFNNGATVPERAEESAMPTEAQHTERVITVTIDRAKPESTPVPTLNIAPPSNWRSEDYSEIDTGVWHDVVETTINGGLTVKNETNYYVDAPSIIESGTDIRLVPDAPQILIIHTHSSEAYTPAGLDKYSASDTNRTEDTEYNIVRVGDELASLWQQQGLSVIHDRGIYDYPSYTGSYSRSAEAIIGYLQQYPTISVVIDMHRDALGSGGVVYKTVAEESGVCASQIMLLVGTDESGLEHPNWRSNLSLALYLQNAVDSVYPTLMRPVSIVPQRYNQHLSGGAFIMEVGSSGNTLQEALAAVRLFAAASAPALLELVETAEEQ